MRPSTQHAQEQAEPGDLTESCCLRALHGAFCPDEDDVEVRCLITFLLRIGDHLVTADDVPHSRAEVLAAIRNRLPSQATGTMSVLSG
ncbi:hypothetical protein [Streptomyces sp. NPDC059781]|uniref:hypothetical protein n=1 Tax=Streptomyces sp. NPDC059781 TaxID=3346943 RepID=UPI00365A0708